MPEIRTDEKSIWVEIKLRGEGFASDPEFDLRTVLSDAVIDRGIGEYHGGGSGGGWMDISFGVDNIAAVDTAISKLLILFVDLKIPLDYVALRVMSSTDLECYDLPELTAGDCLNYLFEDGTYGALIVIQQGGDGYHAEHTLVGLLDYKEATPPLPIFFEERNWLIGTGNHSRDIPYLVWLHCYGGVEFNKVHKINLNPDDPQKSNFNLTWEDVPEYFIRDKFRGDPENNPYERPSNNPTFQVGDCIQYKFTNGDYGAALVLRENYNRPNPDDILIGVLDYKQSKPPSIQVFKNRGWLIDKSKWRKGQPFITWINHCYAKDCVGTEETSIGRLELHEDDPDDTIFGIFWDDLSEHVVSATQ